MNTHPQNHSDKEQKLTLELLQAIDSRSDISQRHLAQEMGVALGLANSYLKRCVKKGLIKMKTAPANRYLYYLTPHGFAEKARLTGEFLSTSLALFRQSGDVYADVLSVCLANAHHRVLFAGVSDLTEIAYMRSLQCEVDVLGVFQINTDQATFFDLPVCEDLSQFDKFDVVIMTSMEQTNELLELLRLRLDEDRIIVPSLLLNMNYRSDVSPIEATL
ncbi:MAG: DNA-binding MarR family transcriptional regulator [Arenicella sp.]|jgi:DNA-binding MarR family transcriptional regulator